METLIQNYSDPVPAVISEYPPYPSRGQAFRSPAVYQSSTHPMRAIAGRTRRDLLVIALIIFLALVLIAIVFTLVAIKKLYFF